LSLDSPLSRELLKTQPLSKIDLLSRSFDGAFNIATRSRLSRRHALAPPVFHRQHWMPMKVFEMSLVSAISIVTG